MKKFWKNLKLRLSLFRIWFFKNILVFLQALLIVILICMFTGAIKPDTPIIGPTLNVLFGGLVEEIRKVIEARQINNFMTFLSVALSVLTTIGIFAIKAKSIAQTDIKSDKMKIAMLQAKLYFDQDGHLKKRVEKATQTDLDGDGQVGEAEVESKGFFRGTFNAIKEFIVIVTAKLDDDPENNEEEKKEILEKAGLTEAAEGQEELDESLKDGVVDMAADEIGTELVMAAADAEADTTLDETDKVAKITFFGKLKNWIDAKREAFHNRKKKSDKKEDETTEEKPENDDIEVIENNVSSDSETREDEQQEQGTDSPTVTTTVETNVVVTTTTTVTTSTATENKKTEDTVNDFLSSYRNRR